MLRNSSIWAAVWAWKPSSSFPRRLDVNVLRWSCIHVDECPCGTEALDFSTADSGGSAPRTAPHQPVISPARRLHRSAQRMLRWRHWNEASFVLTVVHTSVFIPARLKKLKKKKLTERVCGEPVASLALSLSRSLSHMHTHSLSDS